MKPEKTMTHRRALLALFIYTLGRYELHKKVGGEWKAIFDYRQRVAA